MASTNAQIYKNRYQKLKHIKIQPKNTQKPLTYSNSYRQVCHHKGTKSYAQEEGTINIKAIFLIKSQTLYGTQK